SATRSSTHRAGCCAPRDALRARKTFSKIRFRKFQWKIARFCEISDSLIVFIGDDDVEERQFEQRPDGWNVRSDADDAKHGAKRDDSGSAGETDPSTCSTFGARTDTGAFTGTGIHGGGD